MKPLYAARIQDLWPQYFVKVECIACGHVELLPPDKLRIKGLALPAYTPVPDLERRLRCRECDARGKAVVSVKWAEGIAGAKIVVARKRPGGGDLIGIRQR